jgi:flavin-dependent dehydrogenase
MVRNRRWEYKMDEYPVIVVGSGPAGAACAKALKDEGIEVLVIEKDKLPRHKTCSGVLFGQTQVLLKEYFGALPPEDVYCEPRIIEASNVLEWHRDRGFANYVWELSKDGQSFPHDYYNVWRDRFDYWLLGETGAEYREDCEFRNYAVQNNKVNVEVHQKEEGITNFRCSYLIGADGGNSRVRMILDPSWVKNSMAVGIYQAYYRLLDLGDLKDAHWYVFFNSEIGDSFAAVHRKDKVLALCVGGFKGRSLKTSMETLKSFLADNFSVVLGELERDEGCVFRETPPYFGVDRVILTGEAAGMMYLNGEGISAAIDSGYRAGKAVAQGMKEGGDALEIYRKETESIVNHVKLCFEQQHFLVME